MLKNTKSKIAYGIMTACVFCAVLAAGYFLLFSEPERQSYQIVTLGDSVFGQVRDDTAVPAHVSHLLGKSFYNAAFGGTCVARADREFRLDKGNDSLSLVALTQSILTRDFGPQQAAWVRGSNTEYFEETVDGLERIDFSGVETVLICQGLNDYYAGIPIRKEDGIGEEYTFEGALRKSLKALRKVNPDMRIVFITPTYNWHLWSKQTCEELNTGYGVLEDYVDAEIRIAAELGVEVIDLYHDFFPHEVWEDWERYTADGMHPNEAGRELMTERIVGYLRE